MISRMNSGINCNFDDAEKYLLAAFKSGRCVRGFTRDTVKYSVVVS